MPTLTVNTNVSRDKIPQDLLTQLSKLVADSVGKPESYVQVHINPDQMMTFGGSAGPSAACSLASIGCINKAKNKEYTTILTDKLTKSLGIEKDRMYIQYIDLARENVGYNGTTFA